MHSHSLFKWKHTHRFSLDDSQKERNTWRVILLTVIMMGVEIIAGFLYGSMALLADGWHMGTHSAALGITAYAYSFARRYANSPRYSFGTGRVGVLAGFSSAIVLAIVAVLLAAESLQRLLSPKPIQFNEAITVAIIGLAVNLASAFLLQRHDPQASENHIDSAHHQDYNLQAAYLHVLADALTSFLAIFALFAGKIFGWIWMDPIMAIVGSAVIMRWAYVLLRDTGKILLDRNINQETISAIYSAIESDTDNKISDLHIWRVGPQHLAVIISLVTHYPKPPEHYKKLIENFEEVKHITIEVNKAPATSVFS